MDWSERTNRTGSDRRVHRFRATGTATQQKRLRVGRFIPSFCAADAADGDGGGGVWLMSAPPASVSPPVVSAPSMDADADAGAAPSTMCSFFERALRAAFELQMSQCVLFPNNIRWLVAYVYGFT